MNRPMLEVVTPAAAFGRRKVAPRVCIADGKKHIRDFLREALEELGFIASECADAAKLADSVIEHQSDLVVLGLSAGGIAASTELEALREIGFAGRVLVFGPPASPMVTAIAAIGAEIGLDMLPLLPTPFSDKDLSDRVAPLLPKDAIAAPAVDVGEALHGDWLELWYQPKVNVHSLSVVGAEALIRMRHPTWGVFPPERFLPEDGDPHFFTLSEFVAARAAEDWRYFLDSNGPVELAINLPMTFFERPDAVGALARQMPRHPAFAGIIVEFDAIELVRKPELAQRTARQLQLHNIAVAIDDVGADWPALLEFDAFPFVEIKVDRAFVGGLSTDRLKETTCRSIVEFADRVGARTVAEGVETRADFLAARALGFDLIQGFFFARPMEAQKFTRRVLGKPMTVPAD
ncbi:MAG TPA: EAL domain-containing response regulator [Pseudolabrys sp.]|nr:EAL domain-containing response regulator [Pseudolabrys sp.]